VIVLCAHPLGPQAGLHGLEQVGGDVLKVLPPGCPPLLQHPGGGRHLLSRGLGVEVLYHALYVGLQLRHGIGDAFPQGVEFPTQHYDGQALPALQLHPQRVVAGLDAHDIAVPDPHQRCPQGQEDERCVVQAHLAGPLGAAEYGLQLSLDPLLAQLLAHQQIAHDQSVPGCVQFPGHIVMPASQTRYPQPAAVEEQDVQEIVGAGHGHYVT